MGGQEGDFGRRKGEPGKAVQAGKRGKELNKDPVFSINNSYLQTDRMSSCFAEIT